MTKILIVANTDWYLYRFRLSLAQYLREHGFEVVLVSPAGSFVGELEARGFRWINWSVGRRSVNPFGELIKFFDLLRIIKIEKPELIHTHTVKPVLYGSIAARLAHVPAIVRSITGRGYLFQGKDFQTTWLRPLVKILYRYALCSGITLFENNSDREYFIEEKLVNFDNAYLIEGVGVDTDHYQPLPEPDSLDRRPVVLMAARLLWDKGVGDLVDAARIIHQTLEARIVLVGEPDMGNPASIDVKTITQWVEEGVVEWWGWQKDMRSSFAACHVVALPSFGEGIPTVLLEAAACGRSIVATDVPGCRDVVLNGINGLLVPLRDSRALADALLILLKSRGLRNKFGLAGRQLVLDRFSERQIHAKTLTVYYKLL